jgi:hypothetical protein
MSFMGLRRWRVPLGLALAGVAAGLAIAAFGQPQLSAFRIVNAADHQGGVAVSSHEHDQIVPVAVCPPLPRRRQTP